MATNGVYIEGLREITRGMEAAGVEVEELKDVMGAIAADAASTMQGFVPVGTGRTGRAGRLRDSVRGNRAKGKAVVTFGGARIPYARPIQYGWAAHNIKPARFIEHTDAVMETRAVEMLEAGWGQIAERHGLA